MHKLNARVLYLEPWQAKAISLIRYFRRGFFVRKIAQGISKKITLNFGELKIKIFDKSGTLNRITEIPKSYLEG